MKSGDGENMRISSVFSYYGGKSKIINCYPPPKYDLIIEPFAGAAAYAWRWHEKEVWVNELDARVYAIWEFLLRPDALELVRQYVPEEVEEGTIVSQLVPDKQHAGLVELMRAECNQGTQGAPGIHDMVTSMGRTCWKIRPKMEEVIPAIQHWKATQLDYTMIPNQDATWFIDPPYSNVAGRRYRHAHIDYEQLAEWCRSRMGQVIVCENRGARWLPFKAFDHRRVSIRSRYQKADAQEVMWTND
jgi:site-specific DNA-adenine methylase